MRKSAWSVRRLVIGQRAANNESSEVFDIIRPGWKFKIKCYRQENVNNLWRFVIRQRAGYLQNADVIHTTTLASNKYLSEYERHAKNESLAVWDTSRIKTAY